MRLAVIGTGYVGLVSGVCFAELGHEVVCVDLDAEKIDKLRRREVPFYEPGLKELIEVNSAAERLTFTTDLTAAVQRSDIVILAVGTPSLPSGEANLSYIKKAAEEIGRALNGYKIVVTKSTVPVGTNEAVSRIIAQHASYSFDIASVPEFLREGTAIRDTMAPDRIVIGTLSDRVRQTLTELHAPLTANILITDIRSAEMIKYASNAFLATKISFINEISNICEKVGADITRVAEGMGYDKRIGSSFLQAGIGYGGSCFPKDTQALIQLAGNVQHDFKLLKSVVEVNREQRMKVIIKLEQLLGELQGRTIAVWGLSFKPNTDDVREAPSLDIIGELIVRGAIVRAYDPIAADNFRRMIGTDAVAYCGSAIEAAEGADAICLLTEWPEFKELDLRQAGAAMKSRVMIDGRNVYTQEQLESAGYQSYSVGRAAHTQYEANLEQDTNRIDLIHIVS
ncbi:UDP-glucose/GDP-mannose dehydrogenase family protein [Cohnella lubricantis]|uniref:UDP-glucose 6-dehydrogenase n=1 Tax=Cohnella lubricantis TaxID=2163172 RepID=A0A841T699_9BACL|nr:UDP-glucose/GDP-mannose dehydrogenase family protein [Cohnella lubricantis]MBB6676854.1 UDP-glucose/GDP-mannose dehydrogenase family protein [Cohnella lubricantis]MBP2119434.1 UDPglucose 6-dehydrogenase [Cohnella lubricantis]